MALLSKEQILSANDTETRDVVVPEWGGSVRIAVMSGWARDKYEGGLYRDRGKLESVENLRAKYLAYCIVGEDGELLFSAEDIIELGRKSSRAIDAVFEAANELNNAGVEGLEEAAKNS